ncbi:MAG TPA: hypothetical protein VMM55_05185 [Thermohalobaculum sp.]|nr:hypothetical protein [Thermohalobaculum sp.]
MFDIGRKERQRLEKIVDLENTFHEVMRPRSLFTATLPLAEPTEMPRRRVVSLVTRAVEEAGGEAREHEINGVLDGLQREPGLVQLRKPEPEHQLIALWLGGVGVAITLAPVRIKDVDGLATFFAPRDWDEVGRAVKRHKAHVVLYDFGFDGEEQPAGRDAAFNRAAAVTTAAAALGGELGALAVAWRASSTALKPEGLAGAREDLVREHAPLDLWTRYYRTEALPGEHQGIVTSGLAPFVGHEIEIPSSPTDVRLAQNFARQLAADLLDRGLEISDGGIVKGADDLAARVERGVGGRQNVWRLTFVDPWEY